MALVLVIDDEPQMRRIIRTSLEMAGHQVEEAEDGNEGLRRFSELKPELVITDIVMPKGEGGEMIREMRAADPTVPIIAMSGGAAVVGPAAFLEVAEHLGATRMLPKPLRQKDLLQTVDELFGQRALRQTG